MFYEKFADEGNNPMENPNIYNVEGDTRSTTPDGNVLKICFVFQSCFVFLFPILEIILLSTTTSVKF